MAIDRDTAFDEYIALNERPEIRRKENAETLAKMKKVFDAGFEAGMHYGWDDWNDSHLLD
jgi:hypothetical protein